MTVRVLAVLLALRAVQVGAVTCTLDCDGNREVTVDELIVGMRIALGAEPPAACGAVGATPTGGVTVAALLAAVNTARDGCLVVSTPPLLSTTPAAGSVDVARAAWIQLTFATAVDPRALRNFVLTCGGAAHAVTLSTVAANVAVANPEGDLPAATSCTLSWEGPGGTESVSFTTATAGPPVTVLYDRTNARDTTPFPDDLWLTPDATTPTKVRVSVPVPNGPLDVRNIYTVLLQETNKLDGFSPIAHFVLELSDAPDPASLPQTPAESLDPLATVGLFDLTPETAQFGQRIPIRPQIRTDSNSLGVVSHSILVFPSIPLTPGGRYGLVVTRRAYADPTRPFAPSAFFQAVLDPPVAGEPEAVTRVRALADEVLDVVGTRATPPIPRDDVAVAVRISVRSTDDIPHDLLSIKQQILDAPPPEFTIDDVQPDTHADSDVAAIVHGTWQTPDWRTGVFLAHDAQGHPQQTKTNTVEFFLALPKAALDHPVPITMYQHGNPGSARTEVPSHARQSLAADGFAVIGFTDNLNREVSHESTDETEAITAQVMAVFLPLISKRKVPDYWVETHAEQIAFVRMIQGLGGLDVLPIGAPDGVPDLDPSAPLTYLGISEGANHGPGLLPYAPEIHAAALVAGGERLAEVLIHQQAQSFLTNLGPLFPHMTATDIWVALALFQTIFDIQDPHNHARFLYRHPLAINGTAQKASILLIEGLNDSMVPNSATDSLAWAMGPIPHLKPVQRAVPFLDTVDGPLTANIDAQTTAAFFQYVPVGVEGIGPTPGCVVLPTRDANEGHFCAQRAAESLHQRDVFFQSAINDPVPKIINPFAE